MYRVTLSSLAISIFMPASCLAYEIIIKQGDTLSDIAIKYNSSVQEIMSLNRLRNSDQLQIGQKLKLPERNNNAKLSRKVTHKVLNGETLDSISLIYKISQEEIADINNINNINIIYPGQILTIPSDNQEALNRKNKKITVSEYPSIHVISRGDTLIGIAKKYGITVEKLIKLNVGTEAKKLNIGSKLYISKSANKIAKSNESIKPSKYDIRGKNSTKEKLKKPDWRIYGPLKVDWANWKSMNGSYIAPSLNKRGKPLYLAVNCEGKKLNATGSQGAWKDWISPIESFEHDLINDLCRAKSS